MQLITEKTSGKKRCAPHFSAKKEKRKKGRKKERKEDAGTRF